MNIRVVNDFYVNIYIIIKCILVVVLWYIENGVKLVILRNVYL